MRAMILFASSLLLAACQEEPSFDARYDEAAKEIEARAKALDADITDTDSADATDEPHTDPAPAK